MDPMTSRVLAERIGVSQRTASTILSLSAAPDPGKYLTEASYLRALAKVALKAGHQHDALVALAMKDPKRRQETPLPAAGEPVASAPAHARAESTGDVTTDDLQRAASTLRSIVDALGDAIVRGLRSNDLAATVGVLDKFKGLAGEFRQTVDGLEKLRQDHLELLPRSDVYAAAGRMYQVVRGMADAMTTNLLTAGNLPSWIAQAGGTFPESTAGRQTIRVGLRNFAASHFNRMADALGDMAVPVEDIEPELADELRQAMADELEHQAAALRRPKATAGATKEAM